MTSILASLIGAVVLAGVQRIFPKLSALIHQGTATTVTLPILPPPAAAAPAAPFHLTRRVQVKKPKRKRVSPPAAAQVQPETK